MVEKVPPCVGTSDVRKRATNLVQQYSIVMTTSVDNLYHVRFAEFAEISVSGTDIETCIVNLRDAGVTHVLQLLRDDKNVPRPLQNLTRREQVNVRLTSEEKVVIASAARKRGKRISDYMRARALDGLMNT